MPGSAPNFKGDIKTLMLKLYPEKDARVLDVGAGQGIYSDLLRDSVSRIDAIEVHTPYIDQFNLTAKYDVIYPMDCRDFDFTEQFYDVIIFGDIIEHLTAQDAKTVLDRAYPSCDTLIVVVPFQTPQGAVAGVTWEQHLQPDLDPFMMLLRYPKLKPYMMDNRIGVYLGVR